MRRLAIAALVGAAAGTVPAAAEASHSNGAGPQQDFVVGSTRGPLLTLFGTFPAENHVNARAIGPQVPGLGAPARGWFWARVEFPGGSAEFGGPVRCINAVGNQSVIRAVVTHSEGPGLPVGSGTIGRYIDNGEGAGAPPDEFVGRPDAPPSGGADCPPDAFPTLPVEQGNLVVHDAGS
jgi:hypothetical protein